MRRLVRARRRQANTSVSEERIVEDCTENKMNDAQGRVDLHCHSSASNGATGKPADIARALKDAGFSAFALAEHDTLASQDAAAQAAAEVGIEFVPAVEVSTRVDEPELRFQPYMHILGYYLDRTAGLERMLGRAHQGQTESLRRGFHRLRSEGVIDFDEEDVREHVRREWGAGDVWKQAFNCPMPLGQMLQQCGLGRPGEHPPETAMRVLGLTYPPAEHVIWPNVREACDTLHRAGAVVILAHPARADRDCLLRWLDGYIDGIEVYHPRNVPEYRRMLLEVVEETGCAFTGGSDLHWYGYEDMAPLYSDAPYACLESLRCARQRHR